MRDKQCGESDSHGQFVDDGAPAAGKRTLSAGLVQRRTGAVAQAGGGAAPAGSTSFDGLEDPYGLHLEAVQRKGDGAADATRVQEAAAEGTRGAGGPLPHLDRIQPAFGQHDVGGVQAHTGGAAAAASQAMGAEAFATGNHVAFAGAPSLHTAAHEAAHVVQQRGGVQLAGGVGQEGDPYERHADAVADRVVQGQSAADLLDTMAGSAHGVQRATAVQRKDKKVSGTAAARLGLAQAAVEATKKIFAFGAGNQAEALRATNFNSNFRLKVMRDAKCWEVAPEVRELAAANPEAFTTAKAKLAQGGNCGEHASVALSYLRQHASGEQLQKCAKAGLDHAFVIIGDLRGWFASLLGGHGVGADTDSELAVADPWPTRAKACLWEDHFAFTQDRGQIVTKQALEGDGEDIVGTIQAGLKLTDKGKLMITQTLSSEDVESEIDKSNKSKKKWVWNHPDAHGKDKDFDYQQEGTE